MQFKYRLLVCIVLFAMILPYATQNNLFYTNCLISLPCLYFGYLFLFYENTNRYNCFYFIRSKTKEQLFYNYLTYELRIITLYIVIVNLFIWLLIFYLRNEIFDLPIILSFSLVTILNLLIMRFIMLLIKLTYSSLWANIFVGGYVGYSIISNYVSIDTPVESLSILTPIYNFIAIKHSNALSIFISYSLITLLLFFLLNIYRKKDINI